MQATKIDHLVITSKLSSIDNGISGNVGSYALPQALQPLLSEQRKETTEASAALTHGQRSLVFDTTYYKNFVRIHIDKAHGTQRAAIALEPALHLCETLSGHSRDVLESRMLQNE